MENFLESTTLFIVTSAVYFAGRAFDIYTSQDFEYYGLTEKVPFSRDKDGNFDTVKNATFSLIFYAIALLIFIFATGGAWIILAPLAGFSFFQALSNRSNKKSNRAYQIKLLTKLKNGEPITLGFRLTRNGKTFFEPFRFLYSLKPDLVEAGIEANAKISAQANLPEKQWFPK